MQSGSSYERRGRRRFVVDPLEAEDFDRLLAALRTEGLWPRNVIWTWTCTPRHTPTAGREYARLLERALRGPLFFVQALSRVRATSERCRLWCISTDAFAVQDGERVACENAAVAALLQSMRLELDWLDCRHVDVCGGDDLRDNLPHLQRELQCETRERSRELSNARAGVAYRRGRRWRARLAPLVAPTPASSPLVERGRYVVTGGAGGIGTALAADLIARDRARLLLIGRSAAACVEPTLARLRRLGGEVEYVEADVADRARVHAAVHDAEGRWGARLDGVFHLAGVCEARPLVCETTATLSHGLRAKVAGALVLHELLRGRPGALVVHFSSLLGHFGGALHGVYATANAFLAGLSTYERTLGLDSHCLHWSPWHDTGMSRDGRFAEATRGRGYEPLTPPRAIATLRDALRCDHSPLLIGLDAANVHVRRYLDDAPVRPPAARVAGVEPRTEIERKLVAIWQEVLGQPAIGVRDNFFEIGGDSLQAARMFGRVAELLSASLPSDTVLRAPTIERLARIVSAHDSTPRRVRDVPLRVGGPRPPLFCLPGAGDDAHVFRDLTAALPHDLPIFSVQSAALDGSRPHAPTQSIRHVAADLLREIRRVQPHGDYRLIGHCLGGFLAWEVAQQLRAQGARVAVLGLVDTLMSDAPPAANAPLRARVRLHWQQMPRRSPVRALRYIASQVDRYRATRDIRLQRRQLLGRLARMCRDYELQPYPDCLTLFLASDSYLDADPANDPRLTWVQYAARGTAVLRVAGDHETLLREPCVSDLAARLDDILRDSERSPHAAHTADARYAHAQPRPRH